MTDPADKKLDRLLGDWADQRSASKERLQSLRREIDTRLATKGDAAVVELAERVPGSNWPRRIGLGVATAATILIAVVIAQLMPRGSGPADEQVAEAGADADSNWQAHLREQTKLLACCQELFEGRLAWIVDADGASVVELTPAESRPQPAPYIAIRLRLVGRKQGTKPWNELQAVNILAGGEEWVELPTADGESQLAVWAYPVDGDAVSIDLQYRPQSLPEELIEVSTLHNAGRPTSIHDFQHQGFEYRLYQDAEVIPVSASAIDHESNNAAA